jgi:hypothetical protein
MRLSRIEVERYINVVVVAVPRWPFLTNLYHVSVYASVNGDAAHLLIRTEMLLEIGLYFES